MEIGPFFKEMQASRCRPGSPAGLSTAPVEPHPSETCATFPGAAAAAQSTAGASSLTLTAWWSWQLASLNFKPAFDPGFCCGERPPAPPPANSWLEPRWHQQLQPHAIQTAYPHTTNCTRTYPNSIYKHHWPNWTQQCIPWAQHPYLPLWIQIWRLARVPHHFFFLK